MHKIVAFFIFVFFIHCSVIAQSWRYRFGNDYSGPGLLIGEQTLYATEINDSSFVFGGIVQKGNTAIRSTTISKGGSLKNDKFIWAGSIIYQHSEAASRCILKQNNSIYLVTTSYNKDTINNNSGFVGTLAKLNYMGDTVFTKSYPSNQVNHALWLNGISSCVSGGVLLVGQFISVPCNAVLIKCDTNGVEQFRKVYSVNGGDSLSGVCVMQDVVSKKIIIVCNNNVYGDTDPFETRQILVCDSMGNLLRANKIDTGVVQLNDMVQVGQDEYVIVGNYDRGADEAPVAYRVKINNDNTLTRVWRIQSNHYSYRPNQYKTVNLQKNGDLLIGGMYRDSVQVFVSYTKFDLNANQKWHNLYNYNAVLKRPGGIVQEDPVLYSTENTSDSGWISTIWMYSWFPLDERVHAPYLLVKYDKNGCDTTESYCKNYYPTSVSDNGSKTLAFKIVPNPAQNQFYIESTDFELYQYEIVDLAGRSVIKGEDGTTANPISVAGLKAGVYTVRLSREGTAIGVSKLIIEK